MTIEKNVVLLVRVAAEAFRREDYKTALTFYRQLGSILGDKLFSANIFLCQKRLEKLLCDSEEQIRSLSISGGVQDNQPSLFEQQKKLRVAAVMDEFTYSSYKYECNLHQLTPNHWEQELDEFQPELLFIESAWRGKDDLWGSKVGHTSQELRDIVDWCRQRSIPTVFWNKEDPVHFETFLNTAKLFDHVFTTDLDCIHRYKGALGHDQVYLLPFAAQPAVNNPIETYDRKDAFCFAGAYYLKYPERTRDLDDFIDNLSEFKPIEIFDRNFGKDDPNYAFPDDYKPLIVGSLPFEEIDKAYKGYRYAINLNSVKQSQTMFARRVFELLASNTLTVSNFSRGIRILFEDLIVTTDSGKEAVRRLNNLASDEQKARKVRLLGLRKVMSEHTYQDRLRYITTKALGYSWGQSSLPPVVVVSYVNNSEVALTVFKKYRKQRFVNKRLLLITPGGFDTGLICQLADVTCLTASALAEQTWHSLTQPSDWIAPMLAEDHYGENYLTDMVLATRYAPGPLIGKCGHYIWNEAKGLWLKNREQAYKKVASVHARSALIRATILANVPVREWIIKLHTVRLEHPDALSIDEFNYCRNAGLAGLNERDSAETDDLMELSQGLSLEELIQRAERIQPLLQQTEGSALSAVELATMFGPRPNHSPVQMALDNDCLRVSSTLADGKHEYVYASRDLDVAALALHNSGLKFYLDASPGLNLQIVWIFIDAKGQKLNHVVKVGNQNHELELPAGTAKLRLGLRAYGPGCTEVKSVLLGHRNLESTELITKSQHLLLTNHYPSYDDLYRNGFVHSRVTAYRERGVNVDVFRLRTYQPTSYHEYQNVDVVTGSQEALHRLLSTGRYKTMMVHFLNPAMWEVLRHHIDQIRVVVWVHGAEIQPWYRRDFNYETEHERQIAKIQSDERMAFWRELLQPVPANLKLVFVSRYFAKEVMEDLGFRLPDETYTIIHNSIDTELFSYQPKPPEQRKKILSIRPYASRKYANDLSVAAILELSKEPFFHELEFRMIGDGKLFDSVLEPLRQFPNVIIERRFLSQKEIAELHHEYGVFLCPTRMDSQGVSRDEAMASGLVPVTNSIAAIPEFLDKEEGILSGAEDWMGLSEGIASIITDPKLFTKLSENSARRVRWQSLKKKLIKEEIILFTDVLPNQLNPIINY
jgi:glycosyltransferase involved in cell wall biosynthesis/spore maturation protein CgeB